MVGRKPQICFEVSPDTGETLLLEGLRKQFLDSDVNLEEDFTVRHHYQTKRGVNWIVEINPQIFERVLKTKSSTWAGKELVSKSMSDRASATNVGNLGTQARPATKKKKLVLTVESQITVGRTAQMRHSVSIVKLTILRTNLSWTRNMGVPANNATCMREKRG
ncbi:hypothetical protein CDAR_318851 [Caerostris darwini]|uniref:Uncharacterized protein n=1 Tax=Caerostris darwini TaxID=1538125 RepID=A0AAV4Q9H4_9ARAC|nr:hypothetical protein CDAR_430541 [Caerostris darwini]GIY78216.1 hypothetical protein CDAR_318851 [Caerostris darwini]